MMRKHLALWAMAVAVAVVVGGPSTTRVAVASQLNSSANLADSVPANSVSKPATGNAIQFVPSIEDLPLMPGLSALRDEDTVFIVPHGGRIAESAAIGAVDVDEVYRYYKQSLPQLGWKPRDARHYRRNGESLYILARANGKITTVQFSIKPE